MKTSLKTHQKGFTTLEIMIVVAIIALLAALALPVFKKARNRSQNTRFIAELRVATDAFEQFAMNAGGYPPEAGTAVVPSGMEEYLSRFNWALPTSIGGNWDWDNAAIGVDEGVWIIGSIPDSRAAEIDSQIDDGDLITGLFRKRSDGNGYIYITGS